MNRKYSVGWSKNNGHSRTPGLGLFTGQHPFFFFSLHHLCLVSILNAPDLFFSTILHPVPYFRNYHNLEKTVLLTFVIQHTPHAIVNFVIDCENLILRTHEIN